MKKYIWATGLLLVTVVAGARDLPTHCGEDADRIVSLMGDLRQSQLPTGDKILYAAKSLVGARAEDYYRTDSVADLRINIESFSPLMFVNSVIALAKGSEKPGVIDVCNFSDEFENISTRRGKFTGYPSIMFHTSDWIGDNISRGNIVELTENYQGMIPRTKSLDEMTRNRKDFAALADSATFETVRMTEMGFRTHRIPTLKKEVIKKKELIGDLQNGDIIILVPNRDGIDMYDIGFIELIDGIPHLIHVSPTQKEVVEEPEDMARYMQLMTKHFQGFRILRLKE